MTPFRRHARNDLPLLRFYILFTRHSYLHHNFVNKALARAYRQGQTKSVFVYRLAAKDTVDETILQRAKEKLLLNQVRLSLSLTFAADVYFKLVSNRARQSFRCSSKASTSL